MDLLKKFFDGYSWCYKEDNYNLVYTPWTLL